MKDDYESYGAEWEKAIMKLTKAQIIGILRDVGKRQESDAEEALEYRNTLHNCLTTFEYYSDVDRTKNSAELAREVIKQTLLKYD